MTMVMLLGLMFLSIIQPVMMVCSLIIITLVYSYYMMMDLGGYWYSYALIMIMLSGVMVVFMYMSSLIPNEKFEVYSLIFIVFFMWMWLKSSYSGMENNKEYLCVELWNSFLGMFSLMLVVLLFMMMVLVVWFSGSNYKSIRI